MTTVQLQTQKTLNLFGIILFILIIPLMWLPGDIALADDDETDPEPVTSSETTSAEYSQAAYSFSENKTAISIKNFAPAHSVYLPIITTKFTSDFEDAVLDLVNQRRAEAGCGPVYAEQSLHKAAYLHSKDMADNRYFSHTGLDKSRFWQRAERAGYKGFAAGENIAAGQKSPESVMTGWMKSTGHRNNILNCRHTHLGVGHYYGSGSPYGHYWTQVFGRE